EILPYCTLLLGSIRDLTELMEWQSEFSEVETPNEYIRSFLDYYGIEWFAGTKRTVSGGNKQLSGYLITSQESVETELYDLFVLDRIGAGDAFAAGLLLGYAE